MLQGGIVETSALSGNPNRTPLISKNHVDFPRCNRYLLIALSHCSQALARGPNSFFVDSCCATFEAGVRAKIGIPRTPNGVSLSLKPLIGPPSAWLRDGDSRLVSE